MSRPLAWAPGREELDDVADEGAEPDGHALRRVRGRGAAVDRGDERIGERAHASRRAQDRLDIGRPARGSARSPREGGRRRSRRPAGCAARGRGPPSRAGAHGRAASARRGPRAAPRARPAPGRAPRPRRGGGRSPAPARRPRARTPPAASGPGSRAPARRAPRRSPAAAARRRAARGEGRPARR